MSDIKRAVFKPYNGHPQIDADLHAKAAADYRRDLERERDELRAEIEMDDKTIERLRERIEELEDDKAFWKNPPNYVLVDKEKIDKAWAWAEEHLQGSAIWDVFEELGIVRCENPDCLGGCAENDEWKDWVCPDCKGHKWVKEANDE